MNRVDETVFMRNVRTEKYGAVESSEKTVRFKIIVEGFVDMSPCNDGVATLEEMKEWLKWGDFNLESEKIVKVELVPDSVDKGSD